jgi:hypothetical protein
VDATTITGASVVADGAGGQVLIYNGTPGGGNLVGSWSGADGTDGFGNAYVAGLSVNQGVITGIDIDSVTITNATLQGDVLSGSSITQPMISGGTITETSITFDSGGGSLLVYTSGTTIVPQTIPGDYTWVVPAGVTTAQVECWGAGAGGNGGTTSAGGNGGSGGEYAAELNYSVTPAASLNYTVGGAGQGTSTGGGNGNDGGDSFFDGTGVKANGGNGDGTAATGSVNAIHHNGGAGASSGANTGGSSGGNSGNINNPGNSGIAATSSTGAAAPAAQTNSGRGGAGGNSGANGASATAPGGGGGGAGKGTAIGTKTVTYAPLWAGSYKGPDATSGANSLRSTTTMYQGGETLNGGVANGNQYSVFAFNRALIAADFSGYTVTGFQIQMKNQHSWFSSGMTIQFDEYSGLPGSVPGTGPRSAKGISPASVHTGEGEEHNYSLAPSIGQRFVTGSNNGLGIGFLTQPNFPYNLAYYGYFDPGQIRMTITGNNGTAGSFNAGNGADGQVKITYTTGQALVAAISPAAGTDIHGNSYVAGGSFKNLQLFGTATPATPPSNSSILFNSTGGSPSYKTGSGFTAILSGGQANIQEFTNVNSGAWPANSVAWPIPAGDANIGTCYRVTVAGFGSYASGNVNFETLAFGNQEAEATFSGLPSTFAFRAVAECTIVTTGSSGTALYNTCITVGNGANPAAAVGMSTSAIGVNTTAATTISLISAIGPGTPVCTIHGMYSTFERIGS